ncbi:MAG: hypothetical protein KDB79_13310, partial [Acidobacteria bacterium]|nr:hypothetical protein [Acidobacteriota bacterium]
MSLKNSGLVFYSFLLFVVLFIVTLPVSGQLEESDSQKLGADEVVKWRQDLDFIKTVLPAKHKNLFHRLNRETFYAAIEELDGKIPELSRNQVLLEFSRIIGLAKDGHTHFFPAFNRSLKFQFFPVSMYLFDEGIFIRKASPEYADIVGAKIVKIGKMTAEEAFKKTSPYAAGDNEMWAKEYVPILLSSPQVLKA